MVFAQAFFLCFFFVCVVDMCAAWIFAMVSHGSVVAGASDSTHVSGLSVAGANNGRMPVLGLAIQ